MLTPPLRLPLAVAAACVAVGPTHAQVTGFDVDIRTGTIQGDDGRVEVIANAVSIDFDGLYPGSQLFVELTQGEIVNQLFFGAPVNTAPFSSQVAAAPEVLFDTYLAQGDLIGDGPNAAGTPGLSGGANRASLSEVAAVFNDRVKISQAYVPSAYALISDRTDFVVAQVVLTPDAQGRFFYWTRPAGINFDTDQDTPGYVIRDGRVVSVAEGDYDNDGRVSQGDLDLVLQNWGARPAEAGVPAGWDNQLPDAQVSQNELDGVLSNWGGANAPDFTGSAVPEPTALGMLAAAGLLRRRRG